jgi:hypothetical protein
MAWPLGKPFEHAYDLLAALCLLVASLKSLHVFCDICLSLLPKSVSCMLQVLEGVLRLSPNSRFCVTATVHGYHEADGNAEILVVHHSPVRCVRCSMLSLVGSKG